MSILGSKEKAIERLYEALKELVERRRRSGSTSGSSGLDSSDGRYIQAENALVESEDAYEEVKFLAGEIPELYRR